MVKFRTHLDAGELSSPEEEAGFETELIGRLFESVDLFTLSSGVYVRKGEGQIFVGVPSGTKTNV